MLHELDKFYNTDLSFLTITFGQKRIVPYVFMTMHILLSIASLICWFSKLLLWSYVFITMFVLTTILYFWRTKKNLKKSIILGLLLYPIFITLQENYGLNE